MHKWHINKIWLIDWLIVSTEPCSRPRSLPSLTPRSRLHFTKWEPTCRLNFTIKMAEVTLIDLGYHNVLVESFLAFSMTGPSLYASQILTNYWYWSDLHKWGDGLTCRDLFAPGSCSTATPQAALPAARLRTSTQSTCRYSCYSMKSTFIEL